MEKTKRSITQEVNREEAVQANRNEKKKMKKRECCDASNTELSGTQ